MSDRWLIILTLALALILPVSSLVRRDMPARKWLLMIATWAVVFIAAAWAFRALAA